jgi:hypothetical protein
MATAIYLTVSIGLLLMLFWKYASSERARRRRLRDIMAQRPPRLRRGGWSFDRAERAEDREGAMVRSASNSRGWR